MELNMEVGDRIKEVLVFDYFWNTKKHERKIIETNR